MLCGVASLSLLFVPRPKARGMEINMNIVLPISYPTITSYPGRANIFAISEKNNIVKPWLMENYIMTESLYMENRKECDIDFFIKPLICYRNNTALETQYVFNPYLKVTTIETFFIPNEELINFIISNLERGYYLSIGVNTGYINAYDQQILHPIFIYGSNTLNNELYIADFFRNGKYSFEKCTFCEMKKAIENYDDSLITWGGHPYKQSTISLIKIDDGFIYEFDANRLADNILEYLNLKGNVEVIFSETNKLASETAYRKFGIRHYDNMLNYIEKCIEREEVVNNIRLFHVFYDHKKILRQRVNYLRESGYCCNSLLKDVDQIVNEALIIRNCILKDMISGKNMGLINVYDKLYGLKVKERNLLLRTIDIIRNT